MTWQRVAVPKPATAETWMTQGVCRENPPMWDARTGTPGYDPEAIRRCLECPVLDECRDWALSDQMLPLLTGSGVIAGMTSQDRDREHAERIQARQQERLCVHCEKPLHENAHPKRTLHPQCRSARNYRLKVGQRTCRDCQKPVGPRIQFCPDCRTERQRETHRRNNRNQNARRRAKKARTTP